MSNDTAGNKLPVGSNENGLESKRWKISLIGAGNVATHLGQSLAKVADIVQVVSRRLESAQRLSRLIGGGCMAS